MSTTADSLAALVALPGEADSVAAVRTAVDQAYGHRVMRRRWPEVTAEALRASLSSNDTAAEDGLRSVAALQEVADDLPGDPEVTGIEDGDGDGLDDDGKVQVDQDDASACVTLPEAGDDSTQEGEDDDATDAMGDIEVEGGAC